VLAVADERIRRRFQNWCANGLKRFDAAHWVDDLNVHHRCILFAIELAEQKAIKVLSTHFVDALGRVADAATNGDYPSEPVRSKWPEVLDLVPTQQRREFAARVMRAAIDRDGKIPGGFWDLFGGVLTPQTVTDDERALSGLIVPLLRERSSEGLRWFASLLREAPEVSRGLRSNQNQFAALEARLTDYLTTANDGDADSSIREIATHLGIAPTSAAGTDESQTETDIECAGGERGE
jgi:hypothetical protein